MTLACLPIMNQNGRIITVSSTLGLLNNIPSTDLKARFKAAETTLSLDQLNGLMNEFVEKVKNGTYADHGWPKQAYGISKTGATALTKVVARTNDLVNEKQVLVVSCCPGKLIQSCVLVTLEEMLN